jgi:hypothetical protein
MKSSTIESCAQSILIGDRALLRHGSFLELQHGRRNSSRFRSKMGSGTARGRRYLPPSEQAGILPADSTSKGGLVGPTVPLSTPTAMSLNRKPCHQCLSMCVQHFAAVVVASLLNQDRAKQGDFIRRGRQRSPAQKSARLVLSSVIATRSPEQRFNHGTFRQCNRHVARPRPS